MKSVQSHTRSNAGVAGNAKKVLRVGVTGGIGSGKSAVCSLFQEQGIPMIDADSLARILMVHDSVLKSRIIAALGKQMYHGDGFLNRQAMATIIFNHPRRRKELESIVHPRVISEIERLLGGINGVPYAIVEAALIYEAGFNSHLDYVIVVDADKEIRLGRIRERDGLSREDIEQRMKAQMPAETKRKRADFTIINNGTIHELQSQVLCVHRVLTGLSRCKHKKATV